MTIQRADIEPEENRGRAGPAVMPDWRHDASFKPPERVPWSELEEDFIREWAPPTGGNREHWEIIGPSGSGKTRLMLTALQAHYRSEEGYRQANGRDHIVTGGILVVTKQDDAIFKQLGWPLVHSADEIRDTNVIFWPRTNRTGSARREYQESRIRPLLQKLWKPKANTILGFDEVARVERLSGEARELVQMYWTEARSLGIQVIGMKQRPQGALRDMHSETFWTAMFKPGEGGDAERFAELLGKPRDWMPVLDSLSLDDHEFVLRHSRSGEAYISWVDTPLRPQKIRRRRGVQAMVAR